MSIAKALEKSDGLRVVKFFSEAFTAFLSSDIPKYLCYINSN